MLKFSQYLLENTLTLFRGHDKSSEFIGESPFVWFTPSKTLAKEYAKSNIEPEITTIDLNLSEKYIIDMGESFSEVTISDFLDKIISKTNKKINELEPEYSRLSKILNERYGKRKRTLDQYWYIDQDVCSFFKLFGFEIIKTTEKGRMTYGVSRNYLIDEENS